MTLLLRSRTLSVSINSRPKTIYEFVLNLENFPIWAKMTAEVRAAAGVNTDLTQKEFLE